MKEKEVELTRQGQDPRLKSGGNIMPEGQNNGPEHEGKEGQGSRRPLNKISEAVTGEITPAVKDIRDDVRILREQKETEAQKKALANFKRRVKSAWSRQYPGLENAPAHLRSFIRAAMDAGIMPDRLTDEQLELLDEFSAQKASPTSASVGGDSGSREEPPTPTSPVERFIPPAPDVHTVVDEEGINSLVVKGFVTEEQANQYKNLIRKATSRQESPQEIRKQTLEEISDLVQEILNSNDIEAVHRDVYKLLQYARLAEAEDENNVIKDKNDLLQRLNTEEGLQELKLAVAEALPDINKYFSNVEHQIPDVPRSIDDLVALIMRSASAEWKTGGEKELMDKEGKVNKQNFLAWIRKRILDWHEFNPTSEVDFFSAINVRSTWSSVTLLDMVFTGSFFLERRLERRPIGIDSNGKEIFETRETFHRNEDLEQLKNQIVNEVFLFQNSRNFHVKYFSIMGIESELPKTLGGIYGTNLFTRGDFLEQIFTLPSISKKANQQSGEAGREIGEMLEKNGILGEATRRLLLSYNYIYDYEMLSKILGEDAVLFQKEYADIDSYTGKSKEGKAPKTSRGKTSGGETYETEDWFDGQNKLKTNDKLIMDEFMEYVNIFTGPGPNKNAAIIAEVRERLAQSVMQKMGLSYEEAKIAEAWAFSMTRWTGIAAKADTDAVGHDAWTKTLNTFEYRLRQLQEHRNATFGNIFNLLGIKRLSLTFWEGIRDSQGRTVMEAIQGGQGGEYIPDLDLKARKENGEGIDFNEQAMGLFWANHINNSFNALEFLIDYHKFNFQDLITIDEAGRRHIDYEKANKMIDGIQKAIRYLYSTWGGTDYGKTVLTWEKEEIDGNIEVISKEMPILAELFGNEIIGYIFEEEKIAKDIRDKKKDKVLKRLSGEEKERYDERNARKNELNRQRFERHNLATLSDDERNIYNAADVESKNNFIRSYESKRDENLWYVEGLGEIDLSKIQEHSTRQYLWKGVFKYLIKAEIEAHRNPYSDQKKFNVEELESIYTYFKEKGVFSNEELDELRKLTHTTVGRLFLEEGSSSFMAGLAEALKKLRANLGVVTKVS